MKGVNHTGSTTTVEPAAINGTHRTTKKNGAAPKRSGGSGARADVRSAKEPIAAPFAKMDPAPIDAPMWPLHSAVWFQPELAPSVPSWSGLTIERHKRIPSPDFLRSETTPFNCPDVLGNSRDALTPSARPEVPESGLAPLGWDPRAICPKEGGE